jgi:DNA-binding CsgD family transcriptional regulator
MSKSARLRPSDFRALLRLTHECRDLGDDPRRWREHWFRELARMVAGGVVVGGELAVGQTGIPRDLGTVDVGWELGFDRTGWLNSLALLRDDPASNVLMASYHSATAGRAGASLSRRDLLADGVWYRSKQYRTVHEVGGADHTLLCFQTIGGAAGEYSGIVLTRAAGDPDFSAREKGIVGEAHQLLAPLIGGSLARFAEPSPSAPPPRVRQVLRCLLEGDGDKQVAARLGISTYTVNQYVKAIFQHFGVVTRGELLARWVGRGRGVGAWAHDAPPPPNGPSSPR